MIYSISNQCIKLFFVIVTVTYVPTHAKDGIIILAAAVFEIKLVNIQEQTLALTVREVKLSGPFSNTMSVSQRDRPDAW